MRGSNRLFACRTLQVPPSFAWHVCGTPGHALHMQVTFCTSTLRGAGTKASVSFQLHGSRGSSVAFAIQAPDSAFERGGVDAFKAR